MHQIFHPAIPAERHRELLARREDDRRIAVARRQRKATRLRRRAMNLTTRAARLVERTNS